MKWLLIVIIAIVYTAYNYGSGDGTGTSSVIQQAELHQSGSLDATVSLDGTSAIRQAYASKASHVQVEASGTVLKLLTDDNQGSRHQRFIVKLDGGMTLLIVHNIDLANRVAGLQAGDMISFSGEYEWNKKGGLVHWTHHDPQGHHVAGWLKHDGQTYQ